MSEHLRPNLTVAQLRVCAYDAGDDVRIELVEQRSGAAKWAVRRFGSVLNRQLEWEFEPMNSSRDAAFFERARYESADEALTVLVAHRQSESQDPGTTENPRQGR